MTFDNAWPIVDSIGGFYSREELQALWDAASQVPVGGRIVEIGCEKGRSTACLWLATKCKIPIVVVDPFTDHPDARIECEFMGTWRRLGCPPLVLHAMPTQMTLAFGEWDVDKPIGLLHIDGSHKYEFVKTDLFLADAYEAATVCIHDYGRPTLPDVKRAVDEWLAENKRQTELTGTLLVVKGAKS